MNFLGYSGNTTDVMSELSGTAFTTYDSDHDMNPSKCAVYYFGGFWMFLQGYCWGNGVNLKMSDDKYFIWKWGVLPYLSQDRVWLFCP